MAISRNNIPRAPWHIAECSVCGCTIEQVKILSYVAISTQPGSNMLHEVRGFSNEVLILDSGISYSAGSLHATLPTLWLIDIRCYNILRYILAASTVSLGTIIPIITPTLLTDLDSHHDLSYLDAAALVTVFGTSKTDMSITDRLICAVQELPNEISEDILLRCQPDIALAIASHTRHSLFMSVIRKDIARKRITMCVEAGWLLDSKTRQTHYTERIVTLSAHMKATFVCLGGEMYLQSINKESSCLEALDVFIEDGRPEVLALHVDHFGIRNIAFALDNHRRPIWIRGDTRIHKIFLDEKGEFERIRIVSDPLKCRMIDVDLPGRSSLHPRPLLPCHLGRWAPLPTKISKSPSVEVEGYVEPSYINLSILPMVYLSHTPSRGLTGISTESGEDRSQILLGTNAKRSVKLFGLCERIVSGECWKGFAFLQIQTADGLFLPQLDLTGYDLVAEEYYQNIEGIWFVETKEGFLLNVVHEFLGVTSKSN